MNRFQGLQQGLEEYLSLHYIQIPIGGFLLNLILAAILAQLLAVIYVRYGHSLSNRRLFAKNFLLVATTTMFIITVVKSSLALSLGLVGALSIVRFRAAIKEPEELAYLFLCVSVGLGLGADQTLITVLAFLVIVGLIVLKNLSRAAERGQNLCLVVSSNGTGRLALSEIADILKTHCRRVKLRRVDEAEDSVEASFIVDFEDFEKLEKTKSDLRDKNPAVRMQFLDYQGVP